jgi:DNA-binding transcriptional LysR family regulator
MLDLRKIKYFQTIAQYGSISKAATQLHIAQPALSRQIKDLEAFIGVELFFRKSNGIELSAAGTQFLTDSANILNALEQAKANARKAANYHEVLHIGMAPTYTWHPIITGILSLFQKQYPNIQMIIEPTLAIGQSERLSAGSLDAGFMAWRPQAEKRKQGIALTHCHLLIACAKGGEIEKLAQQSIFSLQDKDCIFFPREQSPEFFDFMLNQCHAIDFKPKISQSVLDFNAALGLTSQDLGYTIISSASMFNCPHNITLIQYPELSSSYDLEFVYNKPIKNQNLLLLIALVEQYVATLSGSTG